MPTDCINYQNSGYFSPLMNDYLEQKSNLQSLYNRFPSLENFEEQIIEKKINFNGNDNINGNAKREVLATVLEAQYAKIIASTTTLNNIKLLNNSKTFTITTGHQLNLFSGPLYFLYKIISTINLTKELKAKYPENNFVPIYWMATEDHDFDEINYFYFKGRKFRWNKESTGPVGRLSTEGLEDFFEVYAQKLGSGKNAEVIKKLFQESYLNHSNLADATRFLANELFGEQGLVILDADNPDLKRTFATYIKEELTQQTSHKKVIETIKELKDYAIQVNPREINLFYMEDDLRERIIFENEIYKVNNTKIELSETEILELVENHPEKFSPNVIMRPLYQEVILPNLCYIGGGGEIAYWLELKSFFDAVKVTFPVLLLRNSALLSTEKQAQKANKLGMSWGDLFSKQIDLVNTKTAELSEFSIDFTPQKEQLRKQFEALFEIANQTDKSFLGAVKAQEAKQIRGLENLEKRLLKAQKRKYSETIERITDLQNELFPNKSLQERQANFSEFYLENGNDFIDKLIATLKPLDTNFEIITLH
ncbi:bacillithiol biosynthesis cysteine-adding enzyme BshC [Flavobacterium franklandianum]|uniref:Putative cysteine ligase BshC n=1 Tax=Flavobacterium franklandianum TaxID=2594430 RepID=A0A553C6P3_9FLAO|nr:bacillithiol biosynthesis cysteine-adding enzyme BshC [Flavobacterium franklandianum]TRX16103.1 bacillithiol biosynthesis cysteine-adding enzyme BshC [Flavobacterium franklandianum]TRX23350.1 bacillithiol biosynthesis cysteine-adding enzyme BshC [Flavobacterium franklandianum]